MWLNRRIVVQNVSEYTSRIEIKYCVRVWIDPIKLAANNLTIQEVEQSLKKENVSLPAGSLEATNIDLTINKPNSYIDGITQPSKSWLKNILLY